MNISRAATITTRILSRYVNSTVAALYPPNLHDNDQAFPVHPAICFYAKLNLITRRMLYSLTGAACPKTLSKKMTVRCEALSLSAMSQWVIKFSVRYHYSLDQFAIPEDTGVDAEVLRPIKGTFTTAQMLPNGYDGEAALARRCLCLVPWWWGALHSKTRLG